MNLITISCIFSGIFGLAMTAYAVSNFYQAIIIADLYAIVHGLFALAFASFVIYMLKLAGAFIELEPEKLEAKI